MTDGDVAIAGNAPAALPIERLVVGLLGSESVDVAVVHAESGGDEDCVVDFSVGSAEAAGGLDIGWGHQLAILLHSAGDDEQAP